MGLASRAGPWASPPAPSYPAVPLQLPGAWPRSCRQTFRPRLGLLRALVTRRLSVAPESWVSSLHPRPTLARRAALRSCAGPLGTLHPALDAGRGAERRRGGRRGNATRALGAAPLGWQHCSDPSLPRSCLEEDGCSESGAHPAYQASFWNRHPRPV